MDDYKQTFADFWKELVCDADGNLILDRVMRELHDYRTLLMNVPKVYSHVTGGKVSKANTDADVVIALADDSYQESYETDWKYSDE